MADYYVDGNILTDTGSGTDVDPYGCAVGTDNGNHFQRALNTVTQGATGDNFVAINGGTIDFSGVDLSFATYGTLSRDKPVSFSGATSTIWDGGRTAIDLNGASSFINAQTDVMFQDLDISGGTGTWQINTGSYNSIFRCIIDGGGTTGGIGGGNWSTCVMNRIIGVGANSIIYPSNGWLIAWNYFEHGNSYGVQGTLYSTVEHNIFKKTSTDSKSSLWGGDVGRSHNNSFFSSVATTAACITMPSAGEGSSVYNNYGEGYGKFIDDQAGCVLHMFRNNRWYDMTSANSAAGTNIFETDNSETAASGFMNAAGADYSPTQELRGKGWPSQFLGLAANNSGIDIGAIQIPASFNTPDTREYMSNGQMINEMINANGIYMPRARDVG